MLNRLKAWLKCKILGKNCDYRSAYNAISEANYLDQQVEKNQFKPKYTKIKNFIVSFNLYLLIMSLGYNILLLRELDETREYLDTILEELQSSNEQHNDFMQNLPKHHKAKK